MKTIVTTYKFGVDGKLVAKPNFPYRILGAGVINPSGQMQGFSSKSDQIPYYFSTNQLDIFKACVYAEGIVSGVEIDTDLLLPSNFDLTANLDMGTNTVVIQEYIPQCNCNH